MEEPKDEGKKSLADATRQDMQKEADATRYKVEEIRQKIESLRKRKIENEVQVIEGQPCEVVTVSEDSHSEDSSSPVKKAKPEEKLPSFTPMVHATFKPLIEQTHLEQHKKNVEVVSLDDENSEPVANVINETPEEPMVEAPVVAEPAERRNGALGRPLVKITFYDRVLANEYAALIKDAVAQTLSIPSSAKSGNKSGSVQLEYVIRESDLNDENTQLEGQTFTLDTEPVTAALKWKVPSYSQSFKTIDGQEGDKQEEEPEKRSGGACFNCSGSHMISDCPKPIDQKVVNENRAKFRSSGNQLMRTSRYHADEEQKYSNHRPGQISNELRQALGLRPEQLPLHTYCMRLYGYPPGWLEEARVKHSGISLIEDVQSTNGSAESDQIEEIDPSKIVEFPGFNVPFKLGTMDESYEMGLPQMHWDFSKEAMLQFIKSQKTLPTIAPNDVVEIDDDDDDECVILESNNPETESPVSPPGVNSSESLPAISEKDTTQNPSSPDIELLEASKQQILEELGEDNDASPKSPEKAGTENLVCATPETSLGRSMSSALGTPIVDSSTPYEKLPTAEKFSQGVSEHLNFENLPGATGQYEKMKGIIKRVQKSIQESSK
ncbi:zinc finger CCHC domain-containing protein 8 homolog isoform X2 [Cloeon dipterum]|uniref:zinc finger CCHC domain-containing protein 8 homolog isoform X2 n=1 Tax=Cloeon dipterum TaxID=197152 RepID=UPI0032200AAB